MHRTLDHWCTDDRGTVAILFVIASLGLLLAAGAAIDMQRKYATRNYYQEALDIAVVAGLRSAGDPVQAAQTAFNHVRAASPERIAGVAATPTFTTGANELTGVVNFAMPTSFLKAVGFSGLSINVRSTARRAALGSLCFYVKDSAAPQAFLVNSGAHVDAPDCEAHVATSASPAAIYNAGSSIVTQRTCIRGNTIVDNGGSHPNVELGCAVPSDPFEAGLPTAPSTACTQLGTDFNGGAVNLVPGVYCGGFNFNGAPTVNFAPGVYVIKSGGWNVDGGTWTGADVTFYFADTSIIQFNSAVVATLTAPTSGPYAQVLFYEASGLPPSNFVFDDSQGFNMTGLVWLSSRNVTMNSGATFRSKRMSVVANTLILNNVNWSLEGAPGLGGGVTADVYLSR